jgi:hypothetical protein
MDRTLSILQASSGLIFSTFTLLHLGGHSLAPFGYRFAEQALYATREVFQAPWIEPWLIGLSLVVHSGASAGRFLIRRQRQASAPSKEKSTRQSPSLEALSLHRSAGLVAGSIVFVHIAGTRLAPLFCMCFDMAMIDHT